MPDDSFFIHKKSCASRHPEKTENAKAFRNFFVGVAEQRKRDAELFCERSVGFRLVHTDAQDFRIGFFEFGETSLVRLQFVASGRSVGEDVKSQYDVVTSKEIAEMDVGAGVIGELEIRSAVANFQGRHRTSRALKRVSL